jgi:hypothetical protein
MIKNNPDRFSSTWLPWLHIEYHSDEVYRELMTLDINQSDDQDKLIEDVLISNFRECPSASKRSLMEVLDELPEYPESKVRAMLYSAGPLAESLNDYKTFFEKVKRRCAEL